MSDERGRGQGRGGDAHGRDNGGRHGGDGGRSRHERGGRDGGQQGRSPQRRGPGNPPPARVSLSRLVAYEVLVAVRESDAYANLLLPVRISRAGLSSADAALATELTYGTLRLQGYYDRVIELAAGRPLATIDPPLREVLRLGTHQLLGMRVPSHAAVNESVALTAKAVNRGATGFVNAVLRQIDRVAPEEWQARVADAAPDADERIAALSSHPAWIVRALRAALDSEGRAHELDALLEADNTAPRVNLIALPGLVEPPVGAEPNRFSPYGFTLGAGDPFGLIEGSGGALRVQDEGSQLAALALVAARPIEEGERWLDLCAGPGGKAALLAAETLRGGARLVANELVPARVGLVRDSVRPAAAAVEVVQGDGVRFATSDPDGFDRILLDAPCTGLGALRRRPESRWRKRPNDVAALAGTQASLLDAAVAALRPGGVLAYVTCSPHLGETRAAVAGVLKRHPDALIELPTRDIVQSSVREPLDLADSTTQVQLWPHRHGTDAMFIALLQKR